MDRKDFVSNSTLALLASLFHPFSTCFPQQQPISLKGSFGLKFTNKGVIIDAKDVLIDGLSIPKFAWSWIGLGVAEGVLNFLGGAIINAIFNAIFGGGKSTEQLLNEQLEKFARIVEEAISKDVLRAYQAQVSAFIVLFQEYSNDPKKYRINYLVNESAVKLSEIESLGFIGYRTYMICAGLRLSILQEVYKRNPSEGSRRNFLKQIDRSVSHHKAMIKYIEEQTDPVIVYKDVVEQIKNRSKGPTSVVPINYITVQEKRLGEKIEGKIPIKDYKIYTLDEIAKMKNEIARLNANPKIPPRLKYKDELIDFYAIRKKVKLENTDLGEKMILRWRGKI